MSPRQRKSFANLPMPTHAIPRGVYWDQSGSGRWYVLIDNNGRKARETIAHRDAKASDLHRILEERSGIARDTLNYLIDKFQTSKELDRLKDRTQADYARYAKIAKTFKLQVGTLGSMRVNTMTPPLFRRIFDKISDTPTKANHLSRYLKRVFSYGIEYGYCKSNPLKGVRQLKEVADPKMPTQPEHTAFLATLTGWLHSACELAYLCRLRRVEVIGLTDASATPEGVACKRTKGSRDNLTTWTPRLREAWDRAAAVRDALMTKRRAAIPLRPEDRPLFIGRSGGRMSESTFSTAFDRAMREFGGKRFSIHGLKHRGITDTTDKSAGGHRTEAMRQRYDHEVPKHKPSGS